LFAKFPVTLEYTRYINLLMIYRKIVGLKEILNGELKLWQIFSRRRRRWGVGRSDLGQIPQICLLDGSSLYNYIYWATYIWLCGVVVVALVFGFERSGVRLSVVTVSEYNTFYVLNARFTVKLTTFEGVRITVPQTVTATVEMTFIAVKVIANFQLL